MPTLNLKPTHKPVQASYDALRQYELIRVTNETADWVSFVPRRPRRFPLDTYGKIILFPNRPWGML